MKKFIIFTLFVSLPLISEVLVSNYDNGVVKKKTRVENGLREGITEIYYKNSVLKSETPFKNDNRDGIAKGYYNDGVLKYEKHYKEGALMGQTKTYYKDGKLKSDFTFEDDIPISGHKYLPNGEVVK